MQLSIARVIDDELEDLLIEADIVQPTKQARSTRKKSLILRTV